jgi:hypothetical protein
LYTFHVLSGHVTLDGDVVGTFVVDAAVDSAFVVSSVGKPVVPSVGFSPCGGCPPPPDCCFVVVRSSLGGAVVRSLVVVDACSVDKEVVEVASDVITVVGIFSVVAAADVDGWIVSGGTVETSAVEGCSGMLVDGPALVPASTVVDAVVIGSEVVGTIVGVAKVVILVLSACVEGSSAACVVPSVGA